MQESLKYNENGQAIITDLYARMDRGTVSVKLATIDSQDVQVEITQKASLGNMPGQFPGGSLIFNNQLVEVRSDLESTILKLLKNATFSEKVPSTDKEFKVCLEEAIRFVESEEYLQIAKKVGRLD